VSVISRVMQACSWKHGLTKQLTSRERGGERLSNRPCSSLRLDWIAAGREVHSAEGLRSSGGWQKQIRHRRNLYRPALFASCPMMDARQLVDIMKKILLATVATIAFAAPCFAAEPDKTVGQAPPSGASSFYLTQDTATMKCQVVNAQPAAGGNWKVVGTAHPTHASAETALAADKTCIK
jgi:hypothetical protein